MAQAGQPQKLEEDLDQLQQQEEDEPEPQQPDGNAVGRDRAQSQQVSCPSALWTGTRICKAMVDVWYAAADVMFLHQDLSTTWTNVSSTVDGRAGWLCRPLLVTCSNTLLACRQTGKVHTS